MMGVLFFLHHGPTNSDCWVLKLCLFQYGGGFHNVRTQHILMDVLHIWIDVVGLAQAVWAP